MPDLESKIGGGPGGGASVHSDSVTVTGTAYTPLLYSLPLLKWLKRHSQVETEREDGQDTTQETKTTVGPLFRDGTAAVADFEFPKSKSGQFGGFETGATGRPKVYSFGSGSRSSKQVF